MNQVHCTPSVRKQRVKNEKPKAFINESWDGIAQLVAKGRECQNKQESVKDLLAEHDYGWFLSLWVRRESNLFFYSAQPPPLTLGDSHDQVEPELLLIISTSLVF